MGSAPDFCQRTLVFALNGRRVELQHVDPTTTLLSYLRDEAELKGTKLGCGEGGCGACVVLVSRYDPSSKHVEEFTVNSCLALLCSIDGCAVTTIEGIGNSQDGFHAIQKRFAGFHASQCGFCTPGMCMSLYGALRNHPQEALDLEKSVAGNICRCTGYRPISDVCKSFAHNCDLEDLGLNSFWKLGDKRDKHPLLQSYDKASDPQFPEFLVQELEHKQHQAQSTLSLNCKDSRQRWIRPSTLEEVFAALETHGNEAKLVAGNTSTGIYKDPNPEVVIDIGTVRELLVEEISSQGIEVGAAVKISRVISLLESSHSKSGVYRKLAEHLKKVATFHVRNAGSIGGNLVLAQKLGFDSDIATLFLGAGACVKMVTNNGKEVTETMEMFLIGPWDGNTVLKSIFIPSYERDESIKFESYRASPRPLGNAVAYVNAAFLVRFSSEGLVRDSRLAFGAFGGRHASRASEVEKFLNGKVLDDAVVLQAIHLVKLSIVPLKGTRKAGYRSSLVASFLFKFLSSLLNNTNSSHINSISLVSNTLMRGSQAFEEHTQGAVGHPMSKVMGELQSSGEAVYVDDIPTPRNCVHAAYVYSSKALANIKGIKLDNALSSPGAVSFVSVSDIPSSGKNMGVVTDINLEKLFASDTVECVGQALGLMVADTLKNAKTAATKVEIDYDTETTGPPVLTIEDAVARKEFFEIPPFAKAVMKSKHGNAAEEMAKASHKIENAEVKVGAQYYFYMEPQTALVVPDEDNVFVVYSSCQGPEFVQQSVSVCLGLPMHNIRVITRRVGGGFGGKGTKACLVAVACALAAYKLRRPVRLTLDRNTDMIMMGGRHPMKAVYSAGFDSDGKIKALQAKVFLQGGWSLDFTGVMPVGVLSAFKKFDWGSYDIEFVLCKTNIPSRTVMRGPGDVQGTFLADTVIEHVAALTKLSSSKVMEKNFHTVETAEAVYSPSAVGGSCGYTLPLVWQRLKNRVNFDKRLQGVESFNSSSVWRKRGIAASQCTYFVSMRFQPGRVTIFTDGSVAVETAGVELGQGLWTKVRQATAFSLSEVGVLVDVARVRIVQADTLSMSHGGWTGGSTTSEASCQAVRQACKVLVERFRPIKENMKEQDGGTWESLVLAAKLANVDLAAQTAFVAPAEAECYINYGAAVSEVEIDVLTGEYEILQTDIVYDCGKSMNPAVDIGQTEGAFAQGVGFFTSEELLIDEQGRLINNGTWTYKPPTMDCLPRKLNVELLNSEVHKHRILSSKASGEPPLLLASSVHGAIRQAIVAARKHIGNDMEPFFQLDSPATIDKVRMLCGVENIELHLSSKLKL